MGIVHLKPHISRKYSIRNKIDSTNTNEQTERLTGKAENVQLFYLLLEI